jgi:GNAT superfamily N-acetyltransferase
VGRASVRLADVVGVSHELDPTSPILGRSTSEGMPRGARGLTLHLAGGGSFTVPARRPHELAAALAIDSALPEIRVAEEGDYELIVDVERRADQLFSLSGLGPLPEPAPVTELAAARRLLVAGRPLLGFARIEEVDGVAHLEQLSVLPRAMRRGIGGALLEAACAWASECGYPAITLITFADVAWNGPYYARHGFGRIEELTPGLLELRDWERDIGLDELGERIVMRREL